MILAVLVGLLLLFLAVRVPVGIALGASSVVTMLLFDPLLLESSSLKFYGILQNFILLAVPLFILTGNVAVAGGIAETLARATHRLLWSLRGGLVAQIIPIGVFFAGVTGSSVADVAAMGTFVTPGLVRRGYSRALVNGTIAASATLGILFPPSLTLILYSAIAQVSATALFLAAFLPGLLVAVVMFLLALRLGRAGSPSEAVSPDDRWTRGDSLRVVLALALPALLLAGIYGGLFTISEVSSAAAAYSVLVTILFFDARSPRVLIGPLRDSFGTSVALLTLFVGASLFSFLVTKEGVVTTLTGLVASSRIPLWLVLLLVNVMLLVLGSAMEGLSILLIIVPVLAPVLTTLGVSPLQLGVIIAVNIELGVVLPPFGVNLLTLGSLQKIGIGELAWATVPYLPLLVALLALVTYWPALSTWLPHLIGSRQGL